MIHVSRYCMNVSDIKRRQCNIFRTVTFCLNFTWVHRYERYYRFIVKNHFKSAKKWPALMLFVFCKFYIFVLCLVTEGVKLLLWIKKHASRGLKGNQLIGDPTFVHVYLLRIIPPRKCIAAVCGTKINGRRHQKGLCMSCCHIFI